MNECMNDDCRLLAAGQVAVWSSGRAVPAFLLMCNCAKINMHILNLFVVTHTYLYFHSGS